MLHAFKLLVILIKRTKHAKVKRKKIIVKKDQYSFLVLSHRTRIKIEQSFQKQIVTIFRALCIDTTWTLRAGVSDTSCIGVSLITSRTWTYLNNMDIYLHYTGCSLRLVLFLEVCSKPYIHFARLLRLQSKLKLSNVNSRIE